MTHNLHALPRSGDGQEFEVIDKAGPGQYSKNALYRHSVGFGRIRSEELLGGELIERNKDRADSISM